MISMSEYSHRIVVGIIVVILLTVSVAVEVDDLYSTKASTSFSTSNSPSTTVSYSTSTSTSFSTSNYPTTSVTSVGESPGNASTLGSNGIDLIISLNGTKIVVGETLQVNITLFNDFSEVNSVPTSNDSLFQGVPVALWPTCDYANDINQNQNPGHTVSTYAFSTAAQAVVLMGYYNSENISSVANVHFAPTPCKEYWAIDHAIFQPESSQVSLDGISAGFPTRTNETQGPFQLSTSFTTTGYWNLLNDSQLLNPPVINGQYPPMPPVAIAFVPGVYTVAVADEWGQAAILHFVVEA